MDGEEAGIGSKGPAERRDSRFHLLVVGANHITAPLEVREALARRATYDRMELAGGSPPPWNDLLLLTTCNRIEAYALCRSAGATAEAIGRALRLSRDSRNLYVLEDDAAVDHLLRVAIGLESVAQGEGQITTQVGRAPFARPGPGTRESPLASLFSQAARAGRRIRADLGFAEGGASASHAAFRYIEDAVPVDHPDVVLLGTGKMARLAARALDGRADLTVLGRDPRRARSASTLVGAQSGGFRGLRRSLVRADVVVAATSRRKPILTSQVIRSALAERPGRRLWLIDLGFPRNVDPRCGVLEGVTLVDIDGLAPWGWHPLPPEALAHAESRIREEASRLLRLVVPGPQPGVARFRKAVETVRQDEVNRALARLSRLSLEERSVIDKLATRLVNRFLHEPTEWLRTLPDELSGRAAAELASRLEASIRR